MTSKPELLDLWTNRYMDQARVVESDNPVAVRAAARTTYRAYQEGIEDLYYYGDLETVTARLHRRMRNPLRLARHTTYLAMIADLEGAHR